MRAFLLADPGSEDKPTLTAPRCRVDAPGDTAPPPPSPSSPPARLTAPPLWRGDERDFCARRPPDAVVTGGEDGGGGGGDTAAAASDRAGDRPDRGGGRRPVFVPLLVVVVVDVAVVPEETPVRFFLAGDNSDGVPGLLSAATSLAGAAGAPGDSAPLAAVVVVPAALLPLICRPFSARAVVLSLPRLPAVLEPAPEVSGDSRAGTGVAGGGGGGGGGARRAAFLAYSSALVTRRRLRVRRSAPARALRTRNMLWSWEKCTMREGGLRHGL